jgi:hypothetical protein
MLIHSRYMQELIVSSFKYEQPGEQLYEHQNEQLLSYMNTEITELREQSWISQDFSYLGAIIINKANGI